MDKRTIEDFEKFRVRGSHYEGTLNEKTFSDNDYVKILWHVNGEGRAISAMLQLEDGRIVKQQVWSYDSFFDWKRKRQHKAMMLEALKWVTT